MKAKDILKALGGSGSTRSALDSFRDRYGRGASRQIANQYGVSQRTAQRALAGHTRTPKFTTTERFDAGRAADMLRGVQVAHAGRASVKYDDRDEGSREIGDVSFGPGDLDETIDQLEAGDWDGAGDALDAAVLNGYGGGLGESLTIDDYTNGLTFD